MHKCYSLYNVEQCCPKCGMHITGGMLKDLKGYMTEKKLLKNMCWLALNKEPNLSYRRGTMSPSYAHSPF